MNRIIYLDNNGTTALIKKAKEIYNMDLDGNMSSFGKYGQITKNIYDRCLSIMFDYFNIKPPNRSNYNILFTSGASESNSSIILSRVLSFKGTGKPVIITSSYEHKSIKNCCDQLEEYNLCKIYKINPNSNGIIEPSKLTDLLKSLSTTELNNIVLVTIMHVNNEIGSKNDIYKLATICKEHKIPFHTDCTQSVKFMQYFELNDINSLSLSFHKLGGPKGCGILLFDNTIKYYPIISGSQQNGNRGGTENLYLIYSSIIALNEIIKYRTVKNTALEMLRYKMIKILNDNFKCYYYSEVTNETDMEKPYIIIFGSDNKMYRVPNTIYFSIVTDPIINNNKLIQNLNNKNIIVSKGSTCNSAFSDNKTLTSINAPTCMINCVLRVSLGDENLTYMYKTIKSMQTICDTIKELMK